MAVEYNFTLDMDRSKRDNNIVYARTGDLDSIVINADLVFDGAPYTPTGENAFFECVTPNGCSVRSAAEKSGSTVSVDVPSAAFQAAGVINVAYFRFETGEADNPTYVESTEPFAIVVREGIGDNIDAGDYIEEWRGLADQLEAAVAEVEKKAEQAETAINEQKTEVDQLKAQAQVSIAQDAEDVSDAKDTAISNINSSQGAVDAAIEKLEQKTQEAVDATQEALDGTLATNLQDAIDRTLKLDIADMTDITANSSLSSLVNVGSYCCKTASSAATISDSPVDDSPFNMYVFSSATSGQVMQLVVPIDMNSKPTAEWHVRFGTSSAMDTWSVIGGGADIAAGLGIDVTGDAQKTVSLDTDAFYQHHEAASIIQGSTEVTGGGRIKKLTVYGATRQNLWVNPRGTNNGVTVTRNDDDSLTVAGTNTAQSTVYIGVSCYALRDGATYTASIDKKPVGFSLSADYHNKDGYVDTAFSIAPSKATKVTFTVDFGEATRLLFFVVVEPGTTVSGTYRIMLNEGSEAEPWCPPGLNSVKDVTVNVAGGNLLSANPDDWITTSDTTISIDGDNITVSSTTGSYRYAYLKFGTALNGKTVRISRGTVTASGINAPAMQFMYTVDGVTKYISTATHTIPKNASNVLLTLYSNNSNTSGAASATYAKPYLRIDWEEVGYLPLSGFTSTPIDLLGHTLNSLPDGTRDELTIDATGAVTLTKRVGAADLTRDSPVYNAATDGEYYEFTVPATSDGTGGNATTQMCDRLPIRNPDNSPYRSVWVYTLSSTGRARIGGMDGDEVAFPTSSDLKTFLGADGVTVLYALATPETIELPGVTLPTLPSPDYTIYASSNLPAEIEAKVVKVDYLPPSDVYTKEEVDKKIEDAGGMPDIVPVSQGGTGVTTAAAERNRLGLGNTTGALPVANGGTGAADAKAAQYNLLNSIAAVEGDSDDSSLFAFAYASPSSATGALYKRTGSNVWNWIVSKIRSTFGFTSSNVLPVTNGGTGANNAASARTNLSVYSKSEVDGKVPKVVYGTGNIPGDAANGTIYIQYRS